LPRTAPALRPAATRTRRLSPPASAAPPAGCPAPGPAARATPPDWGHAAPAPLVRRSRGGTRRDARSSPRPHRSSPGAAPRTGARAPAVGSALHPLPPAPTPATCPPAGATSPTSKAHGPRSNPARRALKVGLLLPLRG